MRHNAKRNDAYNNFIYFNLIHHFLQCLIRWLLEQTLFV